MSVPSSGDYTPAHVPTVFMEMPPPPPPPKPAEDKGGVVISRGFLAVLAVLLLGALVASTWILYGLWDGAKGDAQKVRDELQPKLTLAEKANASLTLDKAKVEADRDGLRQKLGQYGAIETQLDQANAEIKRINDLLLDPSKDGYEDVPANKLRLAVMADTRWKEDAEKAVSIKVEKLKLLYTHIAGWTKPAPPPTTTPGVIKPAPTPPPG